MKKAFTLNRNNIKAQYNYGLILQQKNKPQDAEKVYNQALQIDPANAEVLNALTILYLQTNQPEKARSVANVLQQYHGRDPRFTPLLRQMGLQ